MIKNGDSIVLERFPLFRHLKCDHY